MNLKKALMAFILLGSASACNEMPDRTAQASDRSPPNAWGAGRSSVAVGGAAGASGGAAAAGSGSDAAGTAGQAPRGAPTCQERCTSDADCQIGGLPVDARCNPQTDRCESSYERPCSEDVECTAAASGWVIPCTSDAECTIGRCVRLGPERGRCASLEPSEHVSCDIAGMVELTVIGFQSLTEVVVCAKPGDCGGDGRCVRCVTDADCPEATRGKCYPELNQCGCASDADCAASPQGAACDTGTGRCTCRTDTDCHALPGTRTCGTAGVCTCTSDADCAALPGADICRSGHCGCSSPAVCRTATVYDSTEPVCE